MIAADTRATSGPIVADKVSICKNLTDGSELIIYRTARNYTISLLRYGVPAPAQPQIPSSLPPLSPPTSNSTLSRPAANPES